MLDLSLRILSHRLRRRVLTELFESRADDSLCVPEEVACDDQPLEQVALELRHKHLPLMEEAQFIRWDPTTHTVERGTNFDEISPLLDLFASNSHKLPGEWM